MHPTHAPVRRARIPLVGGLVLAAAGALVLTTGPVAHAAEVDGVITGVSVSPTTPVLGGQLRTSIDWCAPASARGGDTFGLTLSDHLGHLPTGFELDDPKTGATVATATIAPSTPWIVTFTFTDYVDTHHDTCGTAYVQSDFDGTTTPSGVRTPITSTTSDGRTFSTVVTPTGSAWGDPTVAGKYGTWTRPDQGRTDPTDSVVWHVDTPQGPYASATTTDTVPSGATWRFDCGTVALSEGSVAQGVWTHVADITAGTTTAVTCSPTSVSVQWPAMTTTDQYRVEIATSEPTANGDGPAITEENEAVVTTVAADGTRSTTDAAAHLVQASAGGEGRGVANATTTPSPATPVPTTPASSAPAPVTPAAVATTAAVATPTASTGTLAFTGQDDRPGIALGAGLLAGGAALLVVARRRRSTAAADAPVAARHALRRH